MIKWYLCRRSGNWGTWKNEWMYLLNLRIVWCRRPGNRSHTGLQWVGSNETHFGQPRSIHSNLQMRRVAVCVAQDRSLWPQAGRSTINRPSGCTCVDPVLPPFIAFQQKTQRCLVFWGTFFLSQNLLQLFVNFRNLLRILFCAWQDMKKSQGDQKGSFCWQGPKGEWSTGVQVPTYQITWCLVWWTMTQQIIKSVFVC